MKMKYLATLLFCFSILNVNAQKVDNFRVEQNGGELSLYYDLTGSTSDIFKVSVLYSANNQDWNTIDKVYGEVGDSILPGKNKKAVLWIEHLKNVESKMYFKVLAEYYTLDQKKEGDLTDKNGNTYNWIRIGKNKWMTQNLKSSKSDGNCGGHFNNSNARNACPDGWQLPTDEDWMALEVEFGVSKDKVNEYGLKEINLNQLANSGFSIEECNYNVSLYANQKALAFWTSTENKMLYTGYSDKYLARIIRINENKISKELRSKNEELSVRCVQSATYLAKVEAVTEKELNLKPVSGITHHPFTGEEIEWQYIGNAIWMKDDITGSYIYKESSNHCPAGWKLPEEQDWKNLFDAFKPSIKLNDSKEVLSDRLSTSGVWGFNLSNNDYWMNTKYYTYNTYWINKKDKEDSKKLVAFPSNRNGQAGWVEKQTNEKAKVRCILDNKDYINKKNQIKTGKFTDKRDQKEYGFVKIENKVWMSENLNFDLGEDCTCRKNIKADCDLFGHMYNIEVAKSGCPDGWRLPTSAEWKYLLVNKAANNLKILYPFGGTGFNLLLGGETIYDDDNKSEIYTAKYLFKDGDKEGYYYIDSKGNVELHEKAKKRDFYYVRCIKEEDPRF